MTEPIPLLQAVVEKFVAENDTAASSVTLLRRIAAADPADHDVRNVPLTSEEKRIFAEVVIEYVAAALQDHRLSADELGRIRTIRHALGLREGEVFALLPMEVESLLNAELASVLRDGSVDSSEALHQVDLQRAFDLGYDDYLKLIQRSIRPLVDNLLREAAGQAPASVRRREALFAKLRQLDTFVPIDVDRLEVNWGST